MFLSRRRGSSSPSRNGPWSPALQGFVLGCLVTAMILRRPPESPFATLDEGTFTTSSNEASIEPEMNDMARGSHVQRNMIQEPIDQSVSATTAAERNFFEIAKRHNTDKVAAHDRIHSCLKTGSCTRPGCKKEWCRPWGHRYDTVYQKWLAPKYSKDDSEPFQFLEIGFYNGRGFQAYEEFLPNGECHSMEISCIEEGPREENKWPWGNFASKNSNYQKYLDEERLHCGDANDINFIDDIWTTKMKRADSPPLMIVVDDGAHLSAHMVQSIFYWFPRIEPGGLLIVEDIQPIQTANKFRTDFLPQIMSDLHYCGDPKERPDEPCFPTLQPLLMGIHCEMHICVFERNDVPAVTGLTAEESRTPEGALDRNTCFSLKNNWGQTTSA